jgi:RNA polymerase primary sigma factor
MASSPKVTPQKDRVPEKGGSEAPDTPLPLLDLSDAAVKKLIRSAKKRGYVTHDQIDSLSKEVNSEQIEDVLAMFSEMGVNVVETEEASEEGDEPREEPDEEAESESGKLVEVQQKVPAKSEAKEPTERTDDPVRMYLREMGSVELLSREGEIAIAKRIEAGREAMIAGLCESPLTFQAIIIWREELNEGKVFLRDIIDLEATYAGPDAKAMPAPVIGPDGQPIVPVPGAAPVAGALAQMPAPPAPPAIATTLKLAAGGFGRGR